jgi:transcriptional regulator with XRE-family HTH domain
MKKISSLHMKWMKNPAYRKEYAGLEKEFASAVSTARARADLTQEQLAERMKTTQSTIARLESGRAIPTVRTLQRIAEATGSRLKVEFEAVPPTKPKADIRQVFDLGNPREPTDIARDKDRMIAEAIEFGRRRK